MSSSAWSRAPLLIRPWLGTLTRAELFVSMVAGLATISGNMLVVYATMIAPVVPDAAGQLLTASLIAAPAAILAALLMLPESEPAAVGAEGPMPRLYDSTMDALVRGTADGLTLLLGIMASLIVFVALVALLNMVLEPLTRADPAAPGRLRLLAARLGPWASRPPNARRSPKASASRSW